MSVEGKRGTKQGKIPKWETELWSYVSSGDGMLCPMYSRCQNRLSGVWCPSDNLDYITQLLDNRRFDVSKYDFVVKRGECGRVFQLVEVLAQKYLKMGRVRCPPVPTALVALVDQRGAIEVRLLALKAYHGAIWHLKDGWIIQLKANDTSAVKRFTLLHEAFHILAHHRTTPVFKKRGAIQGSFNELLADYFAICILTPRRWVKEKWAEVKNLDRMAKIFGVPKPVMGIRLRQLGLI